MRPAVLRLPGWLVFVVFVPLQIWFFLKMVDAWGFWATLGSFVVIGLVAARAARAPWFRALFFPHAAARWERRRHWFQGALFLGAAATWLVPWGPQPWLPLLLVVSLVKSAVR